MSCDVRTFLLNSADARGDEATNLRDTLLLVYVTLGVAITASICICALAGFAAWQFYYKCVKLLDELVKLTSAFTNNSVGRTLPDAVLEVLVVKICASIDVIKAERKQFGHQCGDGPLNERTDLESKTTVSATVTNLHTVDTKNIIRAEGYEDIGSPPAAFSTKKVTVDDGYEVGHAAEDEASGSSSPVRHEGEKWARTDNDYTLIAVF
ncbi:hypothetical protein AAVH_02674 [Aphelenchoides avenae]|nr:hypothetical protein AAVH_02674 [Aphelenchus avenae]